MSSTASATVTAFDLAVATPEVLSNRRSVCLTWLLPGLNLGLSPSQRTIGSFKQRRNRSRVDPKQRRARRDCRNYHLGAGRQVSPELPLEGGSHDSSPRAFRCACHFRLD